MTSRPAETAAVVAAAGFLLARLAGVHDAATVTAIGTLVGAVPALVTWMVARHHRAHPPRRRQGEK